MQEIPGIEKLSGEKVFVTGATSPLGTDVCRLLAAHGVPVMALVRGRAPTLERLGLIELLVGDCSCSGVYGESLRECDFVIHIAGMKFTSSVIRACVGHPALSRVLFVSSTRVHYPERLLGEAERQQKRMLEREEESVTSSRLPWTLLRPTLIHSPQDRSISRVIRRMQSGRFMPLPGSGQAIKQPISAHDLALSTLKALLNPNALRKSYDVPGADVTVYDMIQAISLALDRPVRLIRVPKVLVRVLEGAIRLIGSERHHSLLNTYLRWYEDLSFSGIEAKRDFGHVPREFSVNITEQLSGDHEAD